MFDNKKKLVKKKEKFVGNSVSPTWSVIVKVDRPHVVFRMMMRELYLVDFSVKKTVQTVVGGKREDWIEKTERYVGGNTAKTKKTL